MNQRLKKILYKLKYSYPTKNIAVGAAIVVVFLGFLWGSVNAMQKNYQLRQNVERKKQQKTLSELEVKMLEYQQNYLKSQEYQELEVRKTLGLGKPGEKVLIMPQNSEMAMNDEKEYRQQVNNLQQEKLKSSNFSQWMSFLFGSSAERVKSE